MSGFNMDPGSSYPVNAPRVPNAFGIDYQQTCSLVCLREGARRDMPMRSVGDGLRSLIPHLVGEADVSSVNAFDTRTGTEACPTDEQAGTWGSHAMQALGHDGLPEPASLEDGPWLDSQQAPRFWKYLYKRLYDYIGQIDPTPACGYQVVVSIQARDMAVSQEQVQALCATIGLGEAVCIASTDALLCRWIMEVSGQRDRSERTVAVVAVGDMSILLAAYQVRWGAGLLPVAIRRGSTLVSLPSGQAWWIASLLGQVRSRVSELPPGGYELAARDAAIEFGARLGRVPFDQKLPWIGPLRDRMFQPLQIAPEDCASWPAVSLLQEQLPNALTQVTASLGSTEAEVIVVGGMGAAWPFVPQLIDAARLWQSRSSIEDVARGAAWWPHVIAMHSLQRLESTVPAVLPPPSEDLPSLPVITPVLRTSERVETLPAISDATVSVEMPALPVSLNSGPAEKECASPKPAGDMDAGTAWLLGLNDSMSEIKPPVESAQEEIRPPWLSPLGDEEAE